MSEKTPILEVKNVFVQFTVRGNILTAIRDVSFELFPNETLAIVGESGSGKSVLTKTLTGMLDSNGKVSAGSIIFNGIELTNYKTNKQWQTIRGKRIAMIFQDPMTSLNPLLRIGYQIAEVLHIFRKLPWREAKLEAIKLLKEVGIPDAEKRYHDYPFQYSGGMRQRVVIAIALACRPEILICDEPTTALDVTIQMQILDLIKSLQKEYGFSVIFITHDLGVVAKMADRIAVMYSGKIVEYGTNRDIFYEPAHPYTWALLSSLPQLGEKGAKLYSIVGAPPSLFKDIVGDAFAPRNPYALAIDFIEEPPMVEVSPHHFASSWLLYERAPKVEKPHAIENLHEKMVSYSQISKELTKK
ncbi:MAG TPA: ABC transporter ATP-binding protein [Firmicutes bacterium]|nr:ABC transporter ATP-binding protein [Bacillota bacterium]